MVMAQRMVTATALAGVTLVVAFAGVAFANRQVLDSWGEATSRAASGSVGTDAPDPAEVLADTPSDPTGLGFLALDDPLEDATAVLGPPDRQAPDINASVTHTWDLPHDVEVSVSADALGIVGLYAAVPAAGPLSVSLHDDVVIGRSTPRDVVDAWGPDLELTVGPGDDYVVRAVVCKGPFPVVIKLDQGGAAEVRWDEPVTSALIAYADAEPGTDGC